MKRTLKLPSPTLLFWSTVAASSITFYYYIQRIFPTTPLAIEEFRDREIRRVRRDLGLHNASLQEDLQGNGSNAVAVKSQQSADRLLSELDASVKTIAPVLEWTPNREEAAAVIRHIEDRGKAVQERWQKLKGNFRQ